MSNSDTPTDNPPQEREIAARFAQLRALEAASAPSFRRPQLRAESFGTLPRLAAAVAVVAVGLLLLRESPEDDPAALYAGIVDKQQLQTDALLIVSDSVLPAYRGVPQLYDIESALGDEVDTQ